MRRSGWVIATAVLAIAASGCEGSQLEERAREKTDLPAVNERIEQL